MRGAGVRRLSGWEHGRRALERRLVRLPYRARPARRRGPGPGAFERGRSKRRGLLELRCRSATPPTIGGCPIFPADNPWNTRIDDTTKFPVNPQWATYQATMNLDDAPAPRLGRLVDGPLRHPLADRPAAQAGVPMTFTYADESDPGPYPFPATRRSRAARARAATCTSSSSSTGTCPLYETWSSTYVGPGWSCGSGAKFDLSSNALRPDGWTSADAAGLPDPARAS